jgi:hypothetical protein
MITRACKARHGTDGRRESEKAREREREKRRKREKRLHCKKTTHALYHLGLVHTYARSISCQLGIALSLTNGQTK